MNNLYINYPTRHLKGHTTRDILSVGVYLDDILITGASDEEHLETLDRVLRDILSVGVYLDDILITGASDEEHLETLERVLDRLEKAGLRLKRDKCVLMAPSVVYLGHTIDQDGLHPTKEKVRAILDARPSQQLSPNSRPT